MTYEQLQSLYAKYKDDGFTILAFPSNQFGKQEPGTNEQILEFVTKMFHVTFPMFDKTTVNGKNAHPIFKFLRARLGGTLGSSIKWNFTKFLCDRNGRPIKRYGPPTKPLNFEQDIVELLKQSSNSN